jgi:hypothetical protein
MSVKDHIPTVLGIVVTTSASIAFDGVAKQLVPSDLKAIPAFGIKIGVAIVGGLLANKLAQIVIDNVESVITTVTADPVPDDEEAPSEKEEI